MVVVVIRRFCEMFCSVSLSFMCSVLCFLFSAVCACAYVSSVILGFAAGGSPVGRVIKAQSRVLTLRLVMGCWWVRLV